MSDQSCAVVQKGDRWVVAWDGWYGVDEDQRCEVTERFQYHVSMGDFDAKEIAEAWLAGYEHGARENM